MRTSQKLRPALLGAIAVTALALTSCSSSAGGGEGDQAAPGSLADMDPVTLKVATLYGPDNWQTKAETAYAEAVEKATDGKVSFEFYYQESLTPPAEMSNSLKSGIVDFGRVSMSYTPSEFPYDTWISQAAFIADNSPVAGALQFAGANLEWAYNHEEFTNESRNQGLVPLLPRIGMFSSYNMVCDEEVQSLDDLQGLRARVPGEAWAAEAENLGVVPVSMSASEAYEALQRGLLDCYMGSTQDMESIGLFDIADYYVPLNVTGYSSAALQISEQAWEGLPLEAQQVMWDELPVYLETFVGNGFGVVNGVVEDRDEVVFTDLDASITDKIDEYHASLPERLVAEAPSVVSDPQQAVDSFIAVHEKWEGIVTEDLGISNQAQDWPAQVEQNGGEPVDLQEWSDRIYSEILEPHRPS